MPRFKSRHVPYSIKSDGGSSGFVTCANSSSLNPTAAVSLEIWIKPESYKAGFIFDNSTSGTTNSYSVLLTANGGFAFYATIGGASKVISNTTTKVKMYEWNFLNVTYNGSAVLIFLNGSQLADTVGGSGALGTNSEALRIGKYYSLGSGLNFHGHISRPRVYSRAFTLADHQARYYNDTDTTAMRSGLVLDLALSEGSGTSLADGSGNSNTGTLSGATWSTDTRFKSRTAL